jgi:excinuclease UvrABC nuclease subunit
MGHLPPELRFDSMSRVLELPSVPFANRSFLPTVPGVYFILGDSGRLFYVGEAWVSIKRRICGHKRVKQALQVENVRIAYLPCTDKHQRILTETFAIFSLQPELNVVHKRNPKPYFDW